MRPRDHWPSIILVLFCAFGFWLGYGAKQRIDQGQDHYGEAHGYYPWNFPIGDAATWAAVIVAIGGVIVAVVQFRALKAANATAGKSADAAEKAAQAASDSVVSYQESERGRIVGEAFQLDTLVVGRTAQASFSLLNIGRTPAHVLKVYSRIRLRDVQPSPDPRFTPDESQREQTWVKVDDRSRFGAESKEEITQETLDAIRSHKHFMSLEGGALYTTVHGEYYRMSFVLLYWPRPDGLYFVELSPMDQRVSADLIADNREYEGENSYYHREVE